MHPAVRLARYTGVFISALLLPLAAQSQTIVDTIWMGNPSFEDMPRAGGLENMRPIRGWADCGLSLFPHDTPPDIHPASAWEVQKRPQHGNTYLGMVVRDDESWESLSQALSATLVGGECYALSVWLCRSERYMSHRTNRGDSLYPFDRPAVLRIFGGKSLCDPGELLAESDPISTHQWKRFTFKLEPVRDHRFIMIQAFYNTPVLVPYNGHVLVDNFSPIIRMSCAEEDVVKVLDRQEEEEMAPVNTKPMSPSRPSTTEARPPVKPAPPVIHAETPKLLTELERDKLHQGKTIRIENLYFKADSSRIQGESFAVLDEIAQFMKQNEDIIIEIGGHTNTKPSHDYCNDLSTARARSVLEYLVGRGVTRDQLRYKGYGKNKPLIPNDTYSKSAQAKNQRVELKILSLGYQHQR